MGTVSDGIDTRAPIDKFSAHEIVQPFNISRGIHTGSDSRLICDDGNAKARVLKVQDGLWCQVGELSIFLSIDVAPINVQRPVAIEEDDLFTCGVHELRMPMIQRMPD